MKLILRSLAFGLTSILCTLTFPLAVAEPSPATLRTINDYLTGQPLTAAVADGTVYEFRATVPKVNFWKTPAPLDGLWIESKDKKTLIWMSSTSGTMATDTVPCPPATGGGGGGGNNTDCQNNSPPQTNGCVCAPGQTCCSGTANCYDPATKECCGDAAYTIGTGCCVGNVWKTVSWGSWTVATAPTVTVTAASITNCLGGSVSITATATTQDGTKKRSDSNGCQPEQTSTLALSTPTITWTVSGCTSVPAAGTGATANFTPGSAGNGTVTFTATATTTDSAGTYTGTRSVPFMIVKIESQTVATTPADRTRTTIGVGEKVNLSLNPTPSGTITWSVTGGGTLTDGATPILTTPDVRATCVVTVNFSGGSCTQPFSVIPPSGVQFTEYGADRHKQGYTSAGFLAQIEIQPNTVSFGAIQVREGACPATNTSIFWSDMGGHGQGNWRNVSSDNTIPSVLDNVYSIKPEVVPGGYTWAIPWSYKVGASGDEHGFPDTVNHVFSADNNGTATQSKRSANTLSTAPMPINAMTNWPF